MLFLLSADVEYFACVSRLTIFEAYIGCDIFGKGFSQAFCEPITNILEQSFLKNLTLLSAPLSTPVFSFPFSLHLFISPLSHLSSHFLSSSSPLCISLPCHSLLFSVTHTWWQSLIIYSIGRKVKQQSTAWRELYLSLCAHSFTFNHPQWQWPSFPISSVIRLTAQG